MRRADYLPEAEAAFAAWCGAFTANVVADPSRWGLDESAAAELEAAHAAFVAARLAASIPATRNVVSISAKNQRRQELTQLVRVLVNRVQTFAGLTDADRADLQIARRGSGAPRVQRIGVPATRPLLVWDETRRGGVPRIRISDVSNTSRTALPPGAASAVVFTCTCRVGTAPPDDVRQWHFETVATRAVVPVAPPATPVPPGHVLYVTAAWCSPRGQLGPPAAPLRAPDSPFAPPIAAPFAAAA